MKRDLRKSHRKSHRLSQRKSHRLSQRKSHRRSRSQRKHGFIGMEDIPFHHRLTPRMLEDDSTRQMYGTSHLRDILEMDHRVAEQKELDTLEDDIYQTRKAYLEKHVGVIYDGERVVGFQEEIWQNVYLPPKRYTIPFYLSYTLSPETIHTLLPHYERVRTSKTVEDGTTFLQHALSLKDYVVNIMYPMGTLFHMMGTTKKRNARDPVVVEGNAVMDGTERKRELWIQEAIRSLLHMYDTSPEKKNRYANADDHYSIIPAGTRLYRGFKKRRGPLNVDRGFSFFVWDAVNCIQYAVPNEEAFFDENENDNGSSGAEGHVARYCKQVGGVVEVETATELRLLNLGKASTVRHVLAEMKQRGAPDRILTYMKQGWILSNDTPDRYKRHSVYRQDMEVVQWLQQNGYNGYVAMNVEGLHDEIVLFHIPSSVKVSRVYTVEDFHMPLCAEPYRSLGLGLFAN